MSKLDTTYLDTIEATNSLTLKEYKYVYPRLLSEYRKLGEDCSEMYFIEEQIEQHFIHIDIYKNAHKRLSDDISFEKYTFEDWHKTLRSYDIRIVSLKEIIKFLKQKKQEIETPQPPPPPEKTPTKLSDLITHEKSVEIVESIKIQFKNIKGKRLKLLLLAFQELELLPQERISQKFYDCCKIEFNWNIASYNALIKYEFNKGIDATELSNMKQFLESLIKTN